MAFTFYKTKQLKFAFIVYWILLAYIVAALIWWFIALNRQNHQMAEFRITQLSPLSSGYAKTVAEIKESESRKSKQYLGEGAIFFLLIMAGAVYLFRIVRRQVISTRQQQHFMMAITHELKTPIAVTKLNLETLQKRKLEDSQQKRLIQNTIQEANRLNALCNNMLLTSQFEEGGYRTTKEEFNLSELVTECIADYISRFPQRKLEYMVDPDLFIHGDKLLIQMAINNLIDNAIKYSARESPIHIRLNMEKDFIYVSILDWGKGIETKEKNKVFNKYYRIGNAATKSAKGTGLGLYLTKKIADEHRASILLTDNTPNGSIFTIRFQSV